MIPPVAQIHRHFVFLDKFEQDSAGGRGVPRHGEVELLCFLGPLCPEKLIITPAARICSDKFKHQDRTVRGRRGVPGVRRAWRRQIEPQNHSVVGLP